MNRRWLIFDNVCVIMTGMSVHEILSSSKERPRGQFDYVNEEGDVLHGCDDESSDKGSEAIPEDYDELMELQDYELSLVAVSGLSAHGQQEQTETNADNDDDARRQAEFDVERELDKNPRLSYRQTVELLGLESLFPELFEGDKPKGFWCGDCCDYITPGKRCGHVAVSQRGEVFANDNYRYGLVGKPPRRKAK